LSARIENRCAEILLAPARATPEHKRRIHVTSPPDKPSGPGAEVAQPTLPAAASAADDTSTARRSRRALLWTFTTYFGEGLPWSFLHQMGTEYLTAIGASKTQIGSTSLLHLAVTFKFIWSPLVDLFGRLRTWVIVLQLVLGGGMFAVAAIAPSHNLRLFWVAVGLLSIVHATHDIACDGFYLAALDKVKQALFSGVRVAAFRVAMIAGNSGLVALAGLTDNNWTLAFGAAAILMIATALLNALAMPRPSDAGPRFARETGGEGAAPAGIEARGRRFWEAYASFLLQPQAGLVLSFMFFYKLGDIMMFAMSKPLLRDIGIDTTHRAILNGIGTTSFIVASLVGGAVIARRGLARCLAPMTLFQNLAIPLYIGLAVWRPRFGFVVPVVIIEQFASGIGGAAHVVFLMRRCRTAFSASHYAFATAVVSLGSTLAGTVSGPINEALGNVGFFTVAFVASWPSLVLVFLVPKDDLEVASAASAVRPRG